MRDRNKSWRIKDKEGDKEKERVRERETERETHTHIEREKYTHTRGGDNGRKLIEALLKLPQLPGISRYIRLTSRHACTVRACVITSSLVRTFNRTLWITTWRIKNTRCI